MYLVTVEGEEKKKGKHPICQHANKRIGEVSADKAAVYIPFLSGR